ncbi:4-galactosyl-N-acetylglucosaminide 3-alpha-L-fucosyltransferase 9 isoform X1 [Falco cherrug]|uniref:4-galactosyl-N-acetylglucosaminide 3-alpha-L-fucosyltransferase 9 isoform X1 n=3 Tax=Falco TaxID=8952 RepID=UPI00247A89E5|nr:4-galactosyl-N-acetylglucosaminide 3-alpha-L-fucosyltransferase 9 isoform X1 [Falco cherrug]
MRAEGRRDDGPRNGGLQERAPALPSCSPSAARLRAAPRPPPPPPLRVPAPGADSPSHPPPAAAAAAPGMGSESAPRSSPGPAAPPCSRTRCCSCPAAPRAPGAAPPPRYPQPPPRTEQIMTSTSKGIFRPFLIIFIVLGCFMAFILIYIKPTNSWISGPIESASSVLKMKSFFSSKTDNLNETTILIWVWPFGQTFDLTSCQTMFNIHGCHLTIDRSLYNRSHAVLIHHRDISWDLTNLPQQARPPFQKWIWMNLESPTHTPQKSGIEHLFNLTLTYRRDSDIQVPYGFMMVGTSSFTFEVPSKENLVCWVVSNWNPEHARVKYYNELSKYIEIHTYGQAFGDYINDKNLIPTISTCKFYLSFENSIHKDYITEKLYNALLAGSVPVVLGPSRENYENYIPADSFIHVEDFLSPRDLAEYLLMLDKNNKMYLSYFNWKKDFSVHLPRFWESHACLACDHVKRHQEYKSIGNLEKWFWN